MRGAERGAGAGPHRAGGEPGAARHRALRNSGGERVFGGHRDNRSRQRGAAAGDRSARTEAEEPRRERGAAVREPRNQPRPGREQRRPRPCPSLRPTRGGEGGSCSARDRRLQEGAERAARARPGAERQGRGCVTFNRCRRRRRQPAARTLGAEAAPDSPGRAVALGGGAPAAPRRPPLLPAGPAAASPESARRRQRLRPPRREKEGREGRREERETDRERERGRGGSERAERSAPRGIDRSSHGGRDPPPPPDSRSLRRGAGEKLRGGDTPVGAAHIRCEHNARQETEKTAQGRREAPVRPSFPRSLPPSVLLLLLLLLSPPPAPGQAPLSPAGRTRRRAGGRKQPHFLPFPSPLPIVPPAGQARPGGSPAGPGAAESLEPLPSAAPQGAGTGPGRAVPWSPLRCREPSAGLPRGREQGAGSREQGGDPAGAVPGGGAVGGLFAFPWPWGTRRVPALCRRCS